MPTLTQLAKKVRYYSLLSTTAARSGHPSSCLSATDMMTTLFFGGFFKADLSDPEYHNNDRLIFSKGHAAPLLYALYATAGQMQESGLKTLRQFGSPFEGHPTMAFPYTEAATGSLGQGLSVGVGMALTAKYIDHMPYRTYVLLGDSEMAEGQVWEAMEVAATYKLDHLVAIVDVNRLGQRGETLHGHDIKAYKKKAEAFGWNAIIIDGHNIPAMKRALTRAQKRSEKPTMIIGKTLKGKGISFVENKDGWHGKALSTSEFDVAVKELGFIDPRWEGRVQKPRHMKVSSSSRKKQLKRTVYKKGKMVAPRDAYGKALVQLGRAHDDMVVLDAETSNSTRAAMFQEKFPKRFFEMYIAEQNMVSTALGMSRRGKKPFVSTFAAFLTRAFDQIRMAQYSNPNMVLCGSHAGVSIGKDGSSQMGLEDIAMMRSILDSVVLYPSDAVSTQALMHLAYEHQGLTYIRTTREDTPVLYTEKTKFKIGGSHTLHRSKKDVVTVFAAGITLHEAEKAYQILKKEGIFIRLVDLYSIKSIDTKVIVKACVETDHLIVVEDHYPEGGMADAIRATGLVTAPLTSLAVTKEPRSGTPQELLQYMEIDAEAIIAVVKTVV